ncbi:MAG: diguanylate cyclase [Gammaproteobacteria bacterium]|nr:MAG: diguanylate cyclase [Gammaproteobacteria bacterium]
MLQTIDVGLIVLDQDYTIQVWNSFMENHSGMRPDQVKDKDLFSVFPGIDKEWLTQKTRAVFMLKNRAFTTWEQRPYLMKFFNYRPITGTADFMYQNITISPLISVDGEVRHICLLIYDVTDIATNKLALESANEELNRLSRTDSLTELNDRKYWEECLSKEYARFLRYKHTCSLILFDIDHFKKVNDTYGHQAGDEVIRAISRLLRKSLRQTDIAGRYGSEEFAVILVNTDRKGAKLFAERLRVAIENLTLTYEKMAINFTISLGISVLNENCTDYKTWLEQANSALYQSKHNGRNQSIVFDQIAQR